jgi:hypothetical protein
MNTQEISLEVPAQGARRAPGEGSQHGWKKPERFAARQKSEVVLRLLRGEALDLLSRALGMSAARLTAWREAASIMASATSLNEPPENSATRHH